MKIVQKTVLALSFIAVATVALGHGLDRQARADCLGLQEQAQQLTGFYLTKSQAGDCSGLGIIIKAPTE